MQYCTTTGQNRTHSPITTSAQQCHQKQVRKSTPPPSPSFLRTPNRQNSLQPALPRSHFIPPTDIARQHKSKGSHLSSLSHPHPMLPSPPLTPSLTPSYPLTSLHASHPGPRRRSPLLGRGGGAVGLAAVRLGYDGLLGVGPGEWGEKQERRSKGTIGREDEGKGREEREICDGEMKG